uniref:60S ribosomal protein L36 n=1 Tax=Strongyloides papillosus TaxID=174720 RepID=A0A0N5BQM8_STREA
AAKTVERPLKIRVFFKACTKTCKRHSKYRKNSRRSRRHRKTCDTFRATFEKEGRAEEPTIRVKKLDGKEDKKEHRPTGRDTTRPSRQSLPERRQRGRSRRE